NRMVMRVSSRSLFMVTLYHHWQWTARAKAEKKARQTAGANAPSLAAGYCLSINSSLSRTAGQEGDKAGAMTLKGTGGSR
ncbi:MAG TPA: hypothetical protein VKC57_01430, partial [Ktedonobacterales bacterium]|nr:hypothetical protein [Ktedonobacterales bacterium]